MSDGKAILAAILADPADDLPRWAMADWLDEQGEAMRAEFIRVQLELARPLPSVEGHIVEYVQYLDAAPGWPGFFALVRREAVPDGSCIVRHQQRDDSWWQSKPMRAISAEPFDDCRDRVLFGGCPDYLSLCRREKAASAMPLAQWERHCRILVRNATEDPGWEWSCKRGFPHSVTCTLAAWTAHGPALVRTHPLERVEISDASPMDNSAWGRDDALCEFRDNRPPRLLPPSPTRLPRAIWNLLEGYRELTTGAAVVDGPNNKHYFPRSAKDALSLACLAWAKRAAETLSSPSAPPA